MNPKTQRASSQDQTRPGIEKAVSILPASVISALHVRPGLSSQTASSTSLVLGQVVAHLTPECVKIGANQFNVYLSCSLSPHPSTF